jgi:superfamily II DNA or RNA helicase
MTRLQPAGFFGRFLSSLLPKKLEVQVHCEPQPDGTIALTPVCLIGGSEVDSAFVSLDANQNILGYSVAVGEKAIAVLRQGRATLTKRKAAEHLVTLRRQGIAVRHRATGVPVAVRYVKPNVALALNADDTLDVRSTLVTKQGTPVAKPADLTQLRHDHGWYLAGGNLFHVSTTNTDWDDLLFTARADSHLTGTLVPKFLKALSTLEDKLGHIEKSDSLLSLEVYGEDLEYRAGVEGDQHSIRVSSMLVCHGKNGREHALRPEELDVLQRQGGSLRTAEGWIDLAPSQIEEFRRAHQELKSRLGESSSFVGVRIPETLYTLLEQEGFSSPWSVSLSAAVKDWHRIADGPADVEFRLQVMECDGGSILGIVPVYHYGRFELTHADHLEAASKGETWLRRQNTWIKVDHQACRRIEEIARRLGLSPGEEGYAFPAQQREKVVEAFSPLGALEPAQSYEAFLSQLADFDRVEDASLPETLRSGITLRPYQKQGYNWLAFLQRFGLNGILADDMGLGKTLQTLAIVQKAKEQGKGNLPSLIICPTSVVSNWQAEADKFFTDCPVILYTGSDRATHRQAIRQRMKRSPKSLAAPLVITSYDIARRDYKVLGRIPWLYVVVDEGHNIKNPDAKRTKAIKAIPGQHKLALTGTPIQNKLEELWSLFDFTMPGFLGTRRGFRKKYGQYDQIDWEAVREGSDNLKDRIRPFVLRRLKEHVAKDLPPKIVVDQKVELSPLQVDLYKRVLASADYRRVFEEIDAKGVQRAKVLILKVFTTLRAICNHPVLAKEEYQGAVNCEDSGKLECLRELMEEIVGGEHRALLFCQSTQMLDIIEDFFRKWRYTSLRLDGNTPPPLRLDLVRQFNTDETIQCFLISTKAGGTGLNLTGADTVIFYDHDWNPANDSQAQDRAYRIGQTKPVTVYRLISQGTIEEKILHRQELKQTLADEIINTEEDGFKQLGREELLGLFQLEERRAA